MEIEVQFLRSYFKQILFSVLLLLALTISLLPQTQKLSYDYIDDSLDRAVISFTLAKALNALISVAQGTEIAATPAGVGINFAVGQLLDPINDMVERFSWVMLAASVSLGIQKILTLILGSFALKLLLSLLALLLFYAFIREKRSLALLSMKLFLFIMILRLSMPMIALANQVLYSSFLSPTYIQSTQALQETTNELKAVDHQKSQQNSSVWGKIKQAYKSTADSLNIKKHISTLTEKLNNTFNHMLSLITLFIIETIIFPLLFLYLLLKLLRFTGLSTKSSEAILKRFSASGHTSSLKSNKETKPLF